MRRRLRHRCAANPERDGRRPKIDQRQHDLQHGLKARAVVGQLRPGTTSQSSRVIGAEALGLQAKDYPKAPRADSPRAPFGM